METPISPRVPGVGDLTAFLNSSSQLQSADPPVQDICKYLEKVGRGPQLDHVTLQRVFRALQRWLESVSNYEMLHSGIVPALAKVFDTLLQDDYSKSNVLTSLLDLLFVVEDISEVPRGKEACGSYFISRLLALVPTKLASVNLRRAAVETLCALITRSSSNQQAVLDRRTDCLLLFNFLLPKCGDFQLQASIAETFYRLSKRDPQLINTIKDEDLRRALRSLHEIKRPDLLIEIRNLVVLLNECMGPFRSVYSFMSEWVIINGRNVTAAEEKWVDFGKTLFSFYALSGPVPAKENCGEQIFDIRYVDIIDIRKSAAKQLEIVVHEQDGSQAPSEEQGSVGKQMHIQISFAEEDLSIMMKHVLPKIHPGRVKKDDVSSQSKSSGGSSPRRRTICKSSQGIMIPLRIDKENVQNLVAPNPDLQSAHSTMAVRQTFLRDGNDKKEAKILPLENSARVELVNAAEAKSTKDLSPCSQIIEETLAAFKADAHSPVLQCDDGGSSVLQTKAFKKPADRPRSSTGMESQSEVQKQKEPPMVIVPGNNEVKQKEALSCSIPNTERCHSKARLIRSATDSIPAESSKEQAPGEQMEGGVKEDGGDNVVKNQPDVDSAVQVVTALDVEADIVMNAVRRSSRETAAKHPAWDSADRKKSNVIPRRDNKPRLVKMTRALSGAKRPEPCGPDLLNDVTVMTEGPVAKVESRLSSKRVRLADGIETLDPIEVVSEVPDRQLKDGSRKEGDCTTEGHLVQKSTPAENQGQVYVPIHHKQPVVADTMGSDDEQVAAERRSKRNVDRFADRQLKDGSRKEGDCTTEGHLVQKSTPAEPQGQVYVPIHHKQPVVADTMGSDDEQVAAERRSKRNADRFASTQDYILDNPPEIVPETQHGNLKRLKLTATTDPIESDSEKLEQKGIAISPENHRGAISEPQQIGKRPRGRPRKEKAVKSSSKNIEPVHDAHDGKRKRGGPRKKAKTTNSKENKTPVRSENKIENVYSFSQTENLNEGKRHRRPRKENVTLSTKEREVVVDLDTNNNNVVSFSPPKTFHRQKFRGQKREEDKVVHMEKFPVDEVEKKSVSSPLRSDNRNLSFGVTNTPATPQGALPNEKILTNGRGILRELEIDLEDELASEDHKSRIRKQKETKEVQVERSPVAEVDVPAVSPLLKSDTEVNEPVSLSRRVGPKRKKITSSTTGRGLFQKLGITYDSAYSISPSETVKFRAQRNKGIKGINTKKFAVAEVDVGAVPPHPKSFDPIRRLIIQTVPPEDNVLTPSTKGRGPLQQLNTKIDNVYSVTPSQDTHTLKSPCQNVEEDENRDRVCSSVARTEDEDTPPVRKYREQKSLVRSPKQREERPQKRAPKEKAVKSKGRRAARSKGKEYDKMVSVTSVARKDVLRSRKRALHENSDIDIYYSTPVSSCPPAARPQRKAAQSPPKTDNRMLSSYSPKSDEAADEAGSGDEDWGCGPCKNDNLYHKRPVFVDSEKDEEEGFADSESNVPASAPDQFHPFTFKGKASTSRVQTCKLSKSPHVKFTAPSDAQESDDDLVLASDSMEDPCFSSGPLLRTKQRMAAVSENEDGDEDEGLDRAVTLVEKMLEKFRRKVKLQTKEKTTQILVNAMQYVESDADAFNARLQQDFDDFVKVCKRKFEILEAQRQAQSQKGRIWKEKFVRDFNEYLQGYKGLLSEVKSAEEELKGMAEKQRAVQKRMFNQLQGSVEQHLQNADNKILALKEAAKRMHGLRDVLKEFN